MSISFSQSLSLGIFLQEFYTISLLCYIPLQISLAAALDVTSLESKGQKILFLHCLPFPFSNNESIWGTGRVWL